MKLTAAPDLCGSRVNPGLPQGYNANTPDANKRVHEDVRNALMKNKTGSFVEAERVDIEDTAPDGGWGWVIAFAGFVTWVRLKIFLKFYCVNCHLL